MAVQKYVSGGRNRQFTRDNLGLLNNRLGIISNIGKRISAAISAFLFSNTLSLDFDGDDDFVDVPDNADMRGLTTMSISFWFKYDNSHSGIIVMSKATTSQRVFKIEINSTASQEVELSLYETLTDTSPAQGKAFSVFEDTWHHVVFVVDLDGATNPDKIKCWIDGAAKSVAFASLPIPAVLTGGTAPFAIGKDNLGLVEYGPGNLTQVAFFNTALDGTGVAALRNGSEPADLTGQTGLIHWWPLGEGDTFPTMTDVVGGLNGTMTNMTAGDIVADVPA